GEDARGALATSELRQHEGLPGEPPRQLETPAARELDEAQAWARLDPTSDDRARARDDDDLGGGPVGQTARDLYCGVSSPPSTSGERVDDHPVPCLHLVGA